MIPMQRVMVKVWFRTRDRLVERLVVPVLNQHAMQHCTASDGCLMSRGRAVFDPSTKGRQSGL